MKKHFFILILFYFITVPLLMAQSKGAIISFSSDVYDYGTIYQGADGACEFKFTNTGDEPLVLSSVRSSCGCTVPQWPKDPVLPGQSNVIKVMYDTKRLGTISKQVTVLSNASVPTVTLSIKGNVIQKPAEVLPEKQVNQGFTPSAN